MSPTLRDRLLDRFGVPRDCGWTDDQIMEHIDFGLRHKAPTEPADGTVRARKEAQTADVAWALNCHGLDALVDMPEDVLARLLLGVVTLLGVAQLERDRRTMS